MGSQFFFSGRDLLIVNVIAELTGGNHQTEMLGQLNATRAIDGVLRQCVVGVQARTRAAAPPPSVFVFAPSRSYAWNRAFKHACPNNAPTCDPFT